MKKQPTKIEQVKAYTKEDFDKDLKKMPNRKRMYSVEYFEIEEAPETDFQREAADKITVNPEALDKLVHKEEVAIARLALKEAPLTISERKCLKWTLKGLEPREVGKKLMMNRKTVQTHLLRGRKKLRMFVAGQMGKSPRGK